MTSVYGYQDGPLQRLMDGRVLLDLLADCAGYNVIHTFVEPPHSEGREQLHELIAAAKRHRVHLVAVPSEEDLGPDTSEQDLTRKVLEAAELEVRLVGELR